MIDRPGESGQLVPPGDAHALADAASELYRDDGLRRRLAQGGLARVRGAYTVEHMITATVDVYELARERLLESRSGR